MALAPSVVSQNNQFRLPTVTERIEFSLLVIRKFTVVWALVGL